MANDYSWELSYLITDILHPLVRLPKMEAWLLALLTPIDTIHTEFLALVETKRYELDFTGQVISLERLLNDQFDNGLRRIYIEDGNREEAFFFNDSALGDEIFIFDETGIDEIFIFEGVSTFLYDFVVRVPASLVYDLVRMNALIKKYRQAGKQYIISTF